MKIKSAEFVISNTDYRKSPTEDMPEYAFIGRSNVGKSSLINMLTGNKKLAKTSSKPGKTQLINHFLINEDWFLVDLPGYGFAKAPKSSRVKWENFIVEYMMNRKQLVYTFVLIDSRHAPQKIDLEFMNWCGEKQISFSIIFTKMDKLSSNELQKNMAKYRKEMLKYWEEMPPVFITSSSSQIGKEKVLKYIEHVNEQMRK